MMFEINLLAGKTLVLQHRIVEVMRLAPRFISDYLALEYREKVRSQLNESIFRSVIETSHFANPSEENIGEAHREFANTKRATKFSTLNNNIRVFEIGITDHQTQVKPGGRDASQTRAGSGVVEDKDKAVQHHNDTAKLAHEHEVTPIVFEECYVNNKDYRFVNSVRKSYEVTEAKILAVNDMEGFSKVNDYVGVHLFVLQHGFQGNSIDMRLLKNNLAILHPDGIFLSS